MAACGVPNLADINAGADSMGIDKLTYDIFSILENNFLFGCDNPKTINNFQNVASPINKLLCTGKVRILSIDAGGSSGGILAARSLVHLESVLRRKSGNPNARISDYFDVVAGAGSGGILASLLFSPGKPGKDGEPMFTAAEALNFIMENWNKFSRNADGDGILRRVFRNGKVSGKTFKKLFGELTLKDTLKAVLIPCYDLNTGAPFLFSRADALKMDGCDFNLADVCGVSVTNHALSLKSADGKKNITAVGNGIAMNNPTAAAVTHVLNNKLEFPFCRGVEDIIVVSLGNGEMDYSVGNLIASSMAFVGIAGDGAADMVDQAVSMAFEHSSGTTYNNKYIRIQGNGLGRKKINTPQEMIHIADKMLSQKNVESVLFHGKKLGLNTNLEKLEAFSGELIKEQEERRMNGGRLSPVVILTPSPPRSSSATNTSSSTMSSC